MIALAAEAWVGLVAGLIGSGGILGMAARFLISHNEQSSSAMIDGWNRGRGERSDELTGLRLSFEARLEEIHSEHGQDIRRLEARLTKLHAALVKILPLIPVEHQYEANQILVDLALGDIASNHTNGQE